MGDKSSNSNYRWYILVVSTLVRMLCVGLPMMCMTVLFPRIMQDLNLTVAQIGVVWGMGTLGTALFALPAGLFGDRLGTRITISTGCLLVAVAGALRGVSNSFLSLVIFMLLLGAVQSVLAVNLTKVVREWFTRRELGMANGLQTVGLMIGFTLGTGISNTILISTLGTWRNVLFLYGIISMVFGIVWFLVGREAKQVTPLNGNPVDTVVVRVPFREALSRIVCIKDVWLCAISAVGSLGCYTAVLGYLPAYLEGSGMTAATASAVPSVLLGAGIMFNIFIPILSDKSGLRKVILVPGGLLLAASTFLLPLAHGVSLWVIVIAFACGGATSLALLFVVAIEIKGIGAKYAGTSVGLVTSLGSLGGLLASSVGNSFGNISPTLPFVFWGCLTLVHPIALFFTKETGLRASKADSLRLD